MVALPIPPPGGLPYRLPAPVGALEAYLAAAALVVVERKGAAARERARGMRPERLIDPPDEAGGR